MSSFCSIIYLFFGNQFSTKIRPYSLKPVHVLMWCNLLTNKQNYLRGAICIVFVFLSLINALFTKKEGGLSTACVQTDDLCSN